ncbi:S-layer homology domain-containing protein [Gorillibacterium timonense]|uniref:S-layer homology domain-containing protein n=1 Tax=Gorillibacterium timonense TaxID=1689269 RepID=UPI00071DDEDA|nr:S-layer homology domain-containing protein [Gorillibacterium timonense]
MKNHTRKIVSTTLAASLLMGSIAGLPLSTKGVFEHFGANKAYAADTAATLKERLAKIHAEMTDKEKEAIRTARTDLDKSKLTGTVEIVWQKIIAEYPEAKKDDALKGNLTKLTQSLLLYYDTDLKAVDKLKADYSTLFKTLASYTGKTAPTVADGSQFATELEAALRSSIKNIPSNTDWFTYLSTNRETILATVKKAYDGSETNTAKVLRAYNISSNDLLSVILMANVEVPSLKDAETAFINAYTRILNKENGTTTGTVVVPPAAANFDLNTAKAALQTVASKLAGLLGQGTDNQGLRAATAALQELLRTQAVIDLSSSVTVSGDTAKISINVSSLDSVFANIQEFVKAANEALKKAAPDAKPLKAVVTLDFKTVNAKTVEVPITQELLKKAAQYGIEAIAYKVNGVSLTVDVDQLKADTVLKIAEVDSKVVTDATALVSVSKAYSFTFTAAGKEIKEFAKAVEVRVPVTVPTGVDSELLSLAKIDNSAIVFKGGFYNLNTKEQVTPNKGFSTYTVVENKVKFNDVASVNAWAGKQISVAAAKGIVEGRGNSQFVPNGNVTRAEFAKMLVKAFGLENEAAKESFTDVKDNDWFKPYVAAAVEAGLVTGKSATTFDPNAKITRAEMATMAARALVKVYDYKNVADVKGSLASFKDASKIHSTLQAGVALAAEEGIVVGSNNQFKPEDSATRAEAAVIIYRLINQ